MKQSKMKLAGTCCSQFSRWCQKCGGSVTAEVLTCSSRTAAQCEESAQPRRSLCWGRHKSDGSTQSLWTPRSGWCSALPCWDVSQIHYRSGQKMCWHAALCLSYLLSVSTGARLSFWGPAGRGSSVLPRARPDTTNMLVLREWTCFLMSWVTTCGHVAWFLLLERRGTTTYSRVHKKKVSTHEQMFYGLLSLRRKSNVCLCYHLMA